MGWGNGHLYEEMDGPRSWLGYPRSDEIPARSDESEPWCTIQEFEGGSIFCKENHGSVPVPLATMEFIASREGLQQQLGFPVKAETPLAPAATTPDPRATPNPESADESNSSSTAW